MQICSSSNNDQTYKINKNIQLTYWCIVLGSIQSVEQHTALFRTLVTANRFLSEDALITIVHVFVTSLLDNSDCLLYDISDNYICCLQQVQNEAAQMITNYRKQLLREINCSESAMVRLIKIDAFSFTFDLGYWTFYVISYLVTIPPPISAEESSTSAF